MKKNFKFLLVLIMLLAVIGFMLPVNAEESNDNSGSDTATDQTVTFDMVVENMKKSDVYDWLSSEENSTVKIESTENSMNITYDSGSEDESSGTTDPIVTKFSFADGIISYVYDGPTDVSKLVYKSFVDDLWITQMLYEVGELNGYKEEELEAWFNVLNEDSVFTMEKDGFEISKKDYSFSEDGANLSGNYVENFRIDINEFKIDLSAIDTTSIPVIEFSDIKSDSIGIKIKVENAKDGAMCKLYRAETGGDYKYLLSLNCKDSIIYYDDDLKPNTTYFYKAVLENGTNYSKIYSATTKSVSADASIPKPGDGTVLNPETGLPLAVIVIIVILIILIAVVVVFGVIKNKKEDTNDVSSVENVIENNEETTINNIENVAINSSGVLEKQETKEVVENKEVEDAFSIKKPEQENNNKDGFIEVEKKEVMIEKVDNLGVTSNESFDSKVEVDNTNLDVDSKKEDNDIEIL